MCECINRPRHDLFNIFTPFCGDFRLVVWCGVSRQHPS